MPTFSLTADVARVEAEERAADLAELGASGVEIRDGECAPMPGVPLPAPGRAVLVAYFADPRAAERGVAALGGRIDAVAEEDWSETWKRGLGPVRIGRVLVRPSWSEGPAAPGLAEVVLDPGMAFGTGAHPSTALCLAALSDLVRPGAAVLDVGTGSGILAIAAFKLGAARVVAIDADPVALAVARQNASLNGASVVFLDAECAAVPGTFDVVVANILARTLVALAPDLAARCRRGGWVLLAGILADQAEEVARACAATGLAPAANATSGGSAGVRLDGEWALLALGKRA